MRDQPPRLRRNLSFHVLWFSTFASGVGDRMAMFAALALLGYAGEGADNSSIQSGIDFFFFLPYVLWSPLAGWLTDRLPRKWVLFSADQFRGLFVLAAFLIMPAGAVRVGEPHQWMVWVMIGAIGVMAATFVPAKLSVVPSVVGLGNLTRGNAAVVATGIIGNLIGFLAGGPLAGESVRSVIFVAAGCYMLSGLMWAFLRPPLRKHAGTSAPAEAAAHGPTQPLREIADGIRYAWSHRPVRILIFTAALVWTGTAVYMPALAVVNVEVYGGGIDSLGLLMAPVGFGMLLGAVVLGAVNARLGAELLLAGGLAGCGLFIGLQMVVPSFAIGVAIALGTGLSAGLLLVPLNTMLQRCSADYIRGRVFAAKEITQELGKVVIAGVIWQVPETDPAMRPLSIALAVGLLLAAAWGIRRYILRGPGPTRAVNALWRIARLAAETMHRLRIHGRHHVPRRGPVLLVSNHTSGIDPMLIQAAVPRLVHWMMAREYMIRPLGWLWRTIGVIGIRRNDPELVATRKAINLLREGRAVGVFPEGGIHRGELGRFHSGVELIARRGGATVVPVHISGTPDHRNPLLAYLIPSRSRVIFGAPFTLDPNPPDPEQQVVEIRKRIQRLAETHTDADTAGQTDDPAPCA
jgi:1-acyl-sn-glycerol-3-phosphate acyltransferase